MNQGKPPTTTRPARCLYFHGCMWDCTEICGDGRYRLSPEERQKKLGARVADEQRAEHWLPPRSPEGE